MMALGFLAAFFWLARRLRQAGLSPDFFWEAAPLMILAAVVGARAFYFIFFPDVFFRDPLGAILSRGGLVWYGGMIGLILAVWALCRWKRAPFYVFTDAMSPPAALGLAIGRVGCFLAGCCYGGPCALPWAVAYPTGHPTHGAHVHPAPLYESALTLILAWGLTALGRRWRAPGVVSWSFVLGYGLIRFVTESVRGDRLIWLPELNLSASQAISLIGAALGVAMLVHIARRAPAAASGASQAARV